MRHAILFVAALACASFSGPVLADNHMETKPELANKDWYRIVMTRYHIGKFDEAMELIEPFLLTDDELGRPRPMVIRMNSGEYDVIVIHPMRDGIAAMGWEENPREVRWNAALEKRLGGPEQVKAHWQKYLATVAEMKVEIGHVDLDLAAAMTQ